VEDIDLLIQQLSDLFDHLCNINDVTLRMDIQTDEEIDRFSSTYKRYGQLYRLYFEKKATPKVHAIETHLQRKLRRYGRLGPYREDPIEHEHQVYMREKRKIPHIRKYIHTQQIIEDRREVGNIAEVAFADSIFKDTRKRKVSANSEANKEMKKQNKDSEKQVRLDKCNNNR